MFNFGVHELKLYFPIISVSWGYLEEARFKPYIASNGTRFVSLTTVIVLGPDLLKC